jgi:SAM-dependent methyltransferase
MSTIHYYDQNADAFYNDTINLDMTGFYKPFLELLPANARILDAGCGSGRDSLYFLRHGYDVVAFDASEEMVKRSSALLGKPTLKLKFEDLAFDNEFNGIWASASLLHVCRSDLLCVLSKLKAALREGGVLYASFKLRNDEWQERGRYFNGYDVEALKFLLAAAGLRSSRTWQSPDLRPNRSSEFWVNALAQRESR